MHAVHHPDRIRTNHEWVDWFTNFKADDRGKTVGLEFEEGLWAEKLAIIAILITVAIIVVSIVWVVRGGELQTVFTVMGFVLTGAAGGSQFIQTVLDAVPLALDLLIYRLAEIALVALYYQVTLSD